ncbi:MAG: RluA family pseudouridine synthase [Alphaproteobacteria bacterium]|nr:MAG: RluA family pseudouridine synthase [Alphaproteobacteria bacterium]
MEFHVSEPDAGQRIDKWLSTQEHTLTRQRIQQLMKDGAVACDGRAMTQCSHKVKAGQIISVVMPELVPSYAQAEDIPLDIIYEDAHLLVVNKAAGMVVHPAAGVASGTLVNALLHHCGESLSGIGGVLRPGIVHRLDKDTSGLMIVAKNDVAHHHLVQQLQMRTVSRTYHALCWLGVQPLQGTIHASLGRSSQDRVLMAVTPSGKEAITDYTTLRTREVETIGRIGIRTMVALMECRLRTGRTHQIRVHMKHKGSPLVGDPYYGLSNSAHYFRGLNERDTELLQRLQQFPRQALHAMHLRFIHPHTEQEMCFSAPYPLDLEELIAYIYGG